MNEPTTTDAARAAAIAKMQHDVGIWDCRWEFLDADGNTTNVAHGVSTMEFSINDSVMMIKMEVPDIGTTSVTHRFFHPEHQKLVWISVDNLGDVWTFIEDAEGNVSKSLPHSNEDGSVSHLRFHPLRETTDEVDVLMEISNDEENWTPIFRMCKVRRK